MNALYVKRGSRYHAAGRDAVLDAAAQIVVPEAHGQMCAAPADAVPLCRALVGGREHEEFGVLWLDSRHKLIDAEVLFRGTIDGASVYPREVVKRALEVNASAVILTHNHPSGLAEPSEADRNITLKLAKALTLVEIRLIDHVIVTNTAHVSLAERGLI